ncbi:MAG: SEC-C metal-binding domain-containing protein, partial [Candidatus Kapaibacterium sp.]
PVRRSQRVEVDELGVPIATSMADNPMQFSHPTSTGGASVSYSAGEAETEQRNAPRSTVQTQYRDEPKVGRNDPCPCGSGKKFKQCHGRALA